MLRGKLSRFHLLIAATVFGCAIAIVFGDGPTLWVPVAVLGVLHVAVAALGVTFPQVQMFLPVLWRVPTSRKAVALTFDDGPDPAVTPALLGLLKQYGVSATFFCIGKHVAQYPELARQIAADGHLLGNHTYGHHHGTNFFSGVRLHDDIVRSQETIERITGQRPYLFRPPMGLTNPRVARVVPALGLTTVGWTVRGMDQQAQTPEDIVRRVRRRLRPGAIILLHDARVTGSVLLPAVERLLEELQRDGYEICRLDKLISETC